MDMEDNSYSELKRSLSAISPVVLSSSNRQILTKLDDQIALKSPKGYFRDYRGLAELTDFPYHEVKKLEMSADRTMKILQAWENRLDATLDKLIGYLEVMDRHDLIQDIIPILNFDVEIVSRIEWGASEPEEINPISTPVKHIIICHTATHQCHTKYECSEQMRRIQEYHKSIDWGDIGYNFVIGGDGRVYESAGWSRVGVHTYMWNSRSYGIAFIGNYTTVKPNSDMLRAARLLILDGIKKGFIAENHWLHGARDAINSDSPGDELYAIIRQWPRFEADLSQFTTDI